MKKHLPPSVDPRATPQLFEDLLAHLTGGRPDEDLHSLVRQIIEHELRARLTAETLLQATAALNSTLELDQVLERILEQLQQVVHYDSASVMLIQNGKLRILAVHGHPNPEAALKVCFSPEDNPLAAEILYTRDWTILEDAQQDGRFSRLGEAVHVRGWMGIPMIARGEPIGVLTIDSRTPGVYTPEDARLALAFAGQAALAVTNARLYESEREQRALAQALREISLVLSSSLKADVILAALLEQVEQVVAYDSGRVWLLEGDCVRAVVHRGYERFGVADLVDGMSLQVDSTPNLHYMATTLRPCIVPDVQNDPSWVKTEVSRHFGSWLGAPLVAHSRLLGFLSLDKAEPGFFTAKHARCLESLAGHIALALLNALTFGEVEQASITDYLTGAFNHRYFHQQLRRELDLAQGLGQSVSLLMVDLDHFKEVNDSYGHISGDMVLQNLARRLKLELRANDHLARYGGEEFAIILPGAPARAAREVGERLRRAVAAAPFRVEDTRGKPGAAGVTLTVSVGAATFPHDARDPRSLVAAADQALYQAKADGRNRVRVAEGQAPSLL